MNPFDIDNEVILELIKSDPTLSELYGFSNAESEAPMADLVNELSQYSRGDDRNLAHVAPGDTIIPPELLEADPEFADLVYGRLAEAGIDPAKRVVDSGAANRNPATGAQEFDWDMDGRWSGDGMNAVMYNPPAGGTAADFLEGGGGYSYEDYYNDLLNMDAQQQRDFLRSQGLLEEGVGPYVGATGGTGPITDETMYGDPTQRPGYTPPTTTTTPAAPDDTTFNTLMDQLQSGQYTYGAAGAARDSGQLTPEQFDQFTEAFNQYTGTVPGQRPYSVGETVTGPYTPPAETGTTETTEPTSGATAPTGREGDVDPVLGIPPEIADLIDLGVEIPIPGPGNLPLPIIFGSVQDFIDWTKTLGVDPTGKSYDNILEAIGGAIGDVFNTVKGAIQGSIRGATTGQVNQIDKFIRDLIEAGTTDAGTIINAAQDVLPSILGGGGGGRAGIPPTTGTTTTTGGTGTDIGLPGGEEEDDKAPAETAEPGVPNEEVLGQMGTNQQEVLGKIDQAIAQGTANAEVLDQIARDLGTTKEELLSAMGTTEENLIDYMEGMEGRLNERLDTLGTNQEEILGKVNEAIAQGASNAEALEQVAQDLGTTKEELLSAMGTTEENLMGYVDAATDRVLEQMGTNQQEVLGKLNEAIAQGASNAEALEQVADDLGVAVEDLKGALGTTEENLMGYVDAATDRVLEQMGTNQAEVLGKVNEAIAQGASNAEALEQVAQDLGTTKEELLGALGTTEENLMGYVDAATDRVLEQMGTNQQEVLGKLEEAIAQGASNAEALEQVAQDLGTTKEELLGAMGTSEENLKGYMDGVEGRLTERLNTLETGLYDKMQENLDAGMARADAIDKALEDLATEQGKSKDEILDQMGTNQDALIGRMDELEEGFNEVLGGVRDDLTDLINAGIEAGKTQTEALGDALEELAEQQGKSTEELKAELGLSEERIIDALGGFEERMFDQMGADKDDIIDRVDDAIEQGKSNGEALADLAEELGVSVDYLMDALGTTEENLTDLINESQTAILDELGTTKAEILDSVNEAIAEGKSANEALDELAEQLGTTTEDLLDAVDISTDTIMDELAAFEERQNERLDNATDEILGKVQEGIDTGKTEREALGDALDEIADDLGMTREEILDQLGTTEDRILDEIGASTDVITRDISDLGTQTSLQNLLQLLSQPGVTSQRVDVGEVPLAEIEDLYDFATIFRTPEDAAFFASALGEALQSGEITEEQLLELLAAQ